MNLGSLVTIANMMPSNFLHFVFHNGVYEFSGGQPLPGKGKAAFCSLAKAAGSNVKGVKVISPWAA